jgi:hypothetical protein
VKLYRCDSTCEPHFGRGSFWSGSLTFVRTFRDLRTADGYQFVTCGYALYETDIAPSTVHDIRRPGQIDHPDAIADHLPHFDAEGREWLLVNNWNPPRFEGGTDRIRPEYIRLGGPVVAKVIEEAPMRRTPGRGYAMTPAELGKLVARDHEVEMGLLRQVGLEP